MGMARVEVIAHYLGPTKFGQPVLTACNIDWREHDCYRAVRSPKWVTCQACLDAMPPAERYPASSFERRMAREMLRPLT